ncbi:fructuronate transporter [Falsiruegeria litorea R37]|uniref:Fructuronate transporter n=1 Tax=Falsiruegeria litorea R37 TaxID=1200284 RepID=A0A1Y5TDV3_9RHOB|nr:GntP family permease [Falsiruegeria litorea]SLN58066.1 fructuronate transporter [Falsiruegeria litorea R37]
MIDILSVLLSLVLLMYFAFRGVTLLILAPLLALLAAALTGALPMLASFTQIFMTNTGDFIISFFPLFFLGAIFGKLMDDSGSARSIAHWVIARLGADKAILAVVLCCGVLTYGGVSLFVVAFAIYPIAAALFRDADIPKRLIPGALALGAFTFTMSALPGTPAIQNAIPMPFFGTTAFAAPGLGLIAAAIMAGLGMAWLNRRASRAASIGEGYGEHDEGLPEPDKEMRVRSQGEGFDLNEIEPANANMTNEPSFSLAIAPVVLVVVVNFLFVQLAVPRLDTSYLAEPLFGPTTIEAVRGVWSIIVALTTSILFLLATSWTRLASVKTSLNKGADAAVLPIFNTASLVGFGAVIAALPVFQAITDAMLGLSDGNPLVAVAASVTTLSAITGSASGGMSIALDALGAQFVELAAATHTSLEAMHRVTSVASGALDALPHNGAVITVLGICGLTHREAYGDIFVVAVLVPMIALIAIILLGTLLGGF